MLQTIIDMEKKENKPTGKEIADKYRFEQVRKLGREQIIVAYEELYKLYLDALAENEALRIKLEEKHSKREQVKFTPTYSEYDPSWKGIDKVIYILKENKRIMLSTEILIVITGLDEELRKKWDKPYPALIKYISRAVKANRIIQTKLPTQGIYYGLPEWFDLNGVLNKRFSKISE